MNWEGYSEDLESFEQHSGAEFNLKCPADQAEWGKTCGEKYQKGSIGHGAEGDFGFRIAKLGTRPKGGSPKDNFGFEKA